LEKERRYCAAGTKQPCLEQRSRPPNQKRSASLCLLLCSNTSSDSDSDSDSVVCSEQSKNKTAVLGTKQQTRGPISPTVLEQSSRNKGAEQRSASLFQAHLRCAPNKGADHRIRRGLGTKQGQSSRNKGAELSSAWNKGAHRYLRYCESESESDEVCSEQSRTPVAELR
jgi:hypothetical protein